MKRSTLIIGLIVILCVCATLAGALATGGNRMPSPTRTPAPAQPTATPAGFITRAMFGDAWPFTVDEGQLACNAQQHITFASGGVTYALNGLAKGAIRGGAPYQLIDAIWLDNPSRAGLKISLRPVLDAGLQLCR